MEGDSGQFHPWNTPKGDAGGSQGPCARRCPGLRRRHPRSRRLRSRSPGWLQMWKRQESHPAACESLPAPACTDKSGNRAQLPNPSVSNPPRAPALLLSLHGTARARLLLQGKKSHRSQAGTRPFPIDPHPDQPRLQGHAAPSHPGTDHPSCCSEGLLRGGSRLVPGLKAGARLQLDSAFGSWKFSVCRSHTLTRAHLGREGTETPGKAALVARGAGRWHTGTARLCQPCDPALGIPCQLQLQLPTRSWLICPVPLQHALPGGRRCLIWVHPMTQRQSKEDTGG